MHPKCVQNECGGRYNLVQYKRKLPSTGGGTVAVIQDGFLCPECGHKATTPALNTSNMERIESNPRIDMAALYRMATPGIMNKLK